MADAIAAAAGVDHPHQAPAGVHVSRHALDLAQGQHAAGHLGVEAASAGRLVAESVQSPPEAPDHLAALAAVERGEAHLPRLAHGAVAADLGGRGERSRLAAYLPPLRTISFE